MGILVEKKVQISDDRAKWLARLADVRGTTESALIEEGLDLLLREQTKQQPIHEELKADWDLLQQWESEWGSLATDKELALKLDPDEIVSVVGTPVDAAKIRRIGDPH